ncbi:chorismate-binding protein [Lacinutrix cladophorae]
MLSTAFFEELQQHFSNALPFVVYRKPNDFEVHALLQKADELHVIKDYTESGFVFSPFDNKDDAILLPFNSSKKISSNYDISSEFKAATIHKVSSLKSKEEHIQLVQKGIDAIRKGPIQKVVLSRKEEQHISEENPLKIFKRLLEKYVSAFVYCWYHPKVGLWLGATPETLLKVEGNRFNTMALAGTQMYNQAKDVVWQDKEKDEQQIVTAFVVNSLKDSVSTIKISEVETVMAGNLLHLKTAISGTLDFKNLDFKALLTNLHPTPAVCGFPKEMAKQFIVHNESYNREFYAGFLGELNLKENKTRNRNRRNVENNVYATVKTVSNLFVNLRCMQLKNKAALVYVGGGITKDSVAENEWQETVNKTQTIQAVLD